MLPRGVLILYPKSWLTNLSHGYAAKIEFRQIPSH